MKMILEKIVCFHLLFSGLSLRFIGDNRLSKRRKMNPVIVYGNINYAKYSLYLIFLEVQLYSHSEILHFQNVFWGNMPSDPLKGPKIYLLTACL